MRTTHNNSDHEELANYMEELTGGILRDLLRTDKTAKMSERAIRDIKALALNRLWPMYATTDRGREFLKRSVREDEIERDVARELRAAIAIVKSNPR